MVIVNHLKYPRKLMLSFSDFQIYTYIISFFVRYIKLSFFLQIILNLLSSHNSTTTMVSLQSCDGICIVSIIIVALIDIFIIPFMILSTIKFYKIRNHPTISPRYPQIIILVSIFCIFHIFICEQFMLISIHKTLHLRK